jgi:hypothetical protein
MNENDFNKIDEILKLKEMGMAEKDELRRLIRTYIDSGFSMCMTCDPQVVSAFRRLGKWWELNRQSFSNELKINN